jgi:hypothetical protein
MFIVLCELIATAWLYGMDRFSNNVEMMTGHKPSLYWRITCQYVAPIILFILYICSFIQFDSKEFAGFGDAKTVTKVSIAGWTMSTISTLPIPLYAIWWYIYRRDINIIQQTTTIVVAERIPMEVTDELQSFV